MGKVEITKDQLEKEISKLMNESTKKVLNQTLAGVDVSKIDAGTVKDEVEKIMSEGTIEKIIDSMRDEIPEEKETA